MFAKTRLLGPAVALAGGIVVLALYWGGYLSRLDNAVSDARARMLAHEIDSDIVIVGIDAESIRTLAEWPWPRRHHARLLQHLDRAAPRRVFLDIDFSSHSTPEDDELLERALAQWQGEPVVLAAHIQSLDGADGTAQLARPLPSFERHARLASVTLEQSPDGLVRSMLASWDVGGEVLSSVFADLADPRSTSSVRVDFSILPSSFAYVPYSRLLNGEIDAASLRGKTIYVGATAIELNDTVPVPVHRSLPGIVVQALATETARAGSIRTPGAGLYASLLIGWTLLGWILIGGDRWRRNLALLGAGLAVLGSASVYLYAFHRVDLEIVAFACSLAIVFTVVTLRTLDAQTWRALALAIGLRRREALLRSVVESTTDAIMCIDERGVIRTANAAASRLFGLQPHALFGAQIGTLIPEFGRHDRRPFEELTRSLFECTGCIPNGVLLSLEVSVSRIAVDDDRLFTVIARDISERVVRRKELEHQATHDALTGLPNRRALGMYLEAALANTSPHGRVALLLLDLNRFKEVNDTLGHDVGDGVLNEVANRFASTVGNRGLVSRIGGDEFTVVMSGVADLKSVDAMATALSASLTIPMHVHGIAIEIGVNIGIALAPDHAHDAKGLLRNADIAMYTVKRRGTPFEYYDRKTDQNTVRRLSMISELRSAIENDELSLWFQPQVALQSGHSQSVEALVRWDHHTLGAVLPDEFVTLAESTNLIRPLTEWTMRRALRHVYAWEKQGLHLRAAVNVSPRLLQDSTFPKLLAAVLAESHVSPGQLELEITENAMLLEPTRAMRIVKSLRALGVLISIDDYGAGFSSLGYLRDLSAHALKLDKSFVIDLERRENNKVIVESTVHMAHALGLKIVAEGVESQWVAEYLTRIGYDFAQGYWYAHPMPAEECADWVRQFNAKLQRQAG